MILDKLDALGIRKNTYVIFTSDNGKGLNNGKESILRGDKWWLWEAGIRVPLMIEGPGVSAGSRSSLNTVNYDFLPTFYDIAGGQTSEISHLDGKSILPILEQKDTSHFSQRALYFHYPHLRVSTAHSAIIKGDYKLYTFYETPDKPYLYKLTEDLGEETNLTPQMPEKAQALKKELNDYLGKVNAYFPKENPNADTSVPRFTPEKGMLPVSKKVVATKAKKKK
jgi:arylsulfatase A-like enzyme